MLMLVFSVLLTNCYGNLNGKFWDRGSSEDLVITNLGLKAEKIGMIALVQDHTMISVLIKMPDFTASTVPTQQEQVIINTCSGKNIHHENGDNGQFNRQREYHNAFKQNYNNLMDSFNQRANQYIRSRKDILQPYVLPSQLIINAKRNKRQLLAFLGNTILSFAMGAVSEYQMYKINKHVSENNHAIIQLKEQLDQQKSEIITLKDGLIGITKSLSQKISQFLEQISCSQFFSNLSNRLEFQLHEYTQLVDNLLFEVINGDNSFVLSPRTIDISTIRTIIQRHSELNNTVFYENPLLLYSTCKVNLASVDEDFNYAHFILDIPLIYTNDTTYKLYQPTQVGTFLYNDTCNYYNLPTFMYENNDKFFEIRDLTECAQHNALYVCPTSNVFRTESCFQRLDVSCSYHRKNCDYHYSYKVSTVGVLIRNNLNYDTFAVNSSGWTTLINLSSQRTTYVPWNNILGLQVGDAKLTSPNIQRKPIQTVNLTANLTPFDFIDSTEISQVFGNICEEYNTSLNT